MSNQKTLNAIVSNKVALLHEEFAKAVVENNPIYLGLPITASGKFYIKKIEYKDDTIVIVIGNTSRAEWSDTIIFNGLLVKKRDNKISALLKKYNKKNNLYAKKPVNKNIKAKVKVKK